MKKPFKEGTSKQNIIADGFYRDLNILQTYNEVHVMGHHCHIEEIHETWEFLQKQMDAYFSGSTVDKLIAKTNKLEF